MIVKLTKLLALRERVDRGQVRCAFPSCKDTAVQVFSLQVGIESDECMCIVACNTHIIDNPDELLQSLRS